MASKFERQIKAIETPRLKPVASQISVQALAQELGITDQEIASRKKFLEFSKEDIERLTSVHDLAKTYAEPVIEEFYKYLLSFPETRIFFEDQKVLEYVKRMQKEYFIRLTKGDYDTVYIEDRLKIGAVHERIGLPVKSYLGMYCFYLRNVASRLNEAYKGDPEASIRTFLSLMKITFLDIGLAIDTYISRRERTIQEQQQAIREISTPVLQVREGLLILPIVGIIDSQRARQITQQLLKAIRTTRGRVAVVDVTGVPSVDSTVANHLVQTVEAARLVGSDVIVTGISPEIAQTIVAIGVDLSRITTVGDLQSGIEQAERLLGYSVSQQAKRKD